MRRTALAWLVWFGGLAALLLVDYLLRKSDGNVRTGGIPEPLAGVLLLLLGAVCVWLLYQATHTVTMWKRLTLVGIQAAAGYVFSAAISIYYVCAAGIDCF
jgi:hypothetical protein